MKYELWTIVKLCTTYYSKYSVGLLSTFDVYIDKTVHNIKYRMVVANVSKSEIAHWTVLYVLWNKPDRIEIQE